MSAHLSRHGFRAGYRAIRTALLGVRFSRKRTTKRFSSKSVANEASRDSFKESLRTALANKEKNLVVSLDECYFSEKTLPLYGYSPIGQPCVVRSPTATWKQRSLLLAVGSDGSKVSLISTGSITGEKFRDFIGNLPYAPGTVLLMDNASIHKGDSLLSMRIKGYNPLFTPPYSPEFNPVENVFSVVKGSFRSTWPWVSGIEASICTGIAEATPLTISNAFRHLEHILHPGVSG
jgi:transposase